MSTHNICFGEEIRKISAFFQKKKASYLLLWLRYPDKYETVQMYIRSHRTQCLISV